MNLKQHEAEMITWIKFLVIFFISMTSIPILVRLVHHITMIMSARSG